MEKSKLGRIWQDLGETTDGKPSPWWATAVSLLLLTGLVVAFGMIVVGTHFLVLFGIPELLIAAEIPGLARVAILFIILAMLLHYDIKLYGGIKDMINWFRRI